MWYLDKGFYKRQLKREMPTLSPNNSLKNTSNMVEFYSRLFNSLLFDYTRKFSISNPLNHMIKNMSIPSVQEGNVCFFVVIKNIFKKQLQTVLYYC